MNYFKRWKAAYIRLRQGDICRSGCLNTVGCIRDLVTKTKIDIDGVVTEYQTLYVCEDCNNTGYINSRGRVRSFLNAFGVVRFRSIFNNTVAKDLSEENRALRFGHSIMTRKTVSHLKLERALELFQETHPHANIQDFNALPAETRRRLVEEANTGNFEDA